MTATARRPLLDGDLLNPPGLGFLDVSLRGGWTISGDAHLGVGYSYMDGDGLYAALCRMAVEGPWGIPGREARTVLRRAGIQDAPALAGVARLAGVPYEALRSMLLTWDPLPDTVDAVVRRTWAMRTRGSAEGSPAGGRRPPVVMRHDPELGWGPEPSGSCDIGAVADRG